MGVCLRLSRLLSVLALGLFADNASAEGPFGVTAGDPITSYPSCQPTGPGLYKCSTLPHPHTEFEYYTLGAMPGTGVALIIAVGQKMKSGMTNELYRHVVAMRVDAMLPLLKKNYGEPTFQGKTASVPFYHWEEKRGFRGPEEIENVKLSGIYHPDGPEDGAVEVVVEFKNIYAYEIERDNLRDAQNEKAF